MTRTFLTRLRHMTFAECRWRAGAAARTTVDRVRVRLRAPRWDRSRLARVLSPSVVDQELRAALARRDWRAAHDSLARRLQPPDAPDVRTAVLSRWPSAAAEAAARADRILAGHYDLLGYRDLSFAAPSRGRSPAPSPERSAAPSHRRTRSCDVDWHRDPVHDRCSPRACWADVPYLDPAIGDHKIIWELNRHQHWLPLARAACLTRDPRYAAGMIDQLESWLDANPPLVGTNWSSMLEIGLRSIAWTSALPFLLAGVTRGPEGSAPPDDQEPWLVDMLVAIHRQLTHVERHLSHYFSPNTHLTGEALALFVVGHALPALAASARWIATGRQILLQEIDRQILPDGGHVERSTHYQRYTLDFYLLALLTAERAGDSDAAVRFADAVTRLAAFTRTMADDHGRLPLIGDDDGGMLWPVMGRECRDVRDSLALAALVLDRPDWAPWGAPEEVFWIAPRAAIDRAPPVEASRGDADPLASRTFPDTGYVVARDAAGGHAVFDVGAHGHMNGGHAHADALSLTLGVGHRPLLVDPGTSTYTMDARLRDRMRGSANHNTVTIDGRPQSVPAGPFRWRTSAGGHLHASRHNAGFDWAEGTHDGYGAIEHRRSIVRADDAGWLVVDEVGGPCASATTHWHFDPAWTVTPDSPGRLRATQVDGSEAWLLYEAGELSLVRGDDESGLGWYAPVYGTLFPTWTARLRREGVAPFSMVTWIGAGGEAAGRGPSLARIEAAPDPSGRAVAARVSAGGYASVFLLRTGEPAWRDSRTCGVDGYQTNARALHVRTAGDHLVTLDLVDGRHALALRDGWVSIEAAEPVADLHAAFSDTVLDLTASAPPRQLRIQGTRVAHLRDVRLNGRPCPPRPLDRADTLLISGGEWGEAPPGISGPRLAMRPHAPAGRDRNSPLKGVQGDQVDDVLA